jgi:ATP-dependent DNA helicase RecQ
MQLLDALHAHFGFRDFRPGQQPALQSTLEGRDTLVVMPTGSGKSLIYQLAALLLPGVAVVISPLVALMKDQADGLARRNLPATFINSSLAAAEQSRRLWELAAGQYKIVLVAPERLRSPAFHQAMAQLRVSLLAVDEAHCVSQWGHDFRPDYLRLGEARHTFKAPVTLALTATATRRVQDDIITQLGMSAEARRIITGFNRPNLSFEVYPVASDEARLRLLGERLSECDGAGIIYTGTRRDAEAVAGYVGHKLKRPARYYHGALDAATRSQVQDAFLSGDLPLVVATNAFGLGIDRPDVRFVLHYSLPGTLEAYYQEAGRAGRDGLPARAILLYGARDARLHEFFIDNDAPSAGELRAVHAFVAGRPEGFAPEELQQAASVGQTKMRLALQQLEAAGALSALPEDAPGLRRMRAGRLAEAALRAIGRQVDQRRAYRRGQLARMLDYAESGECRRRVLLRHFGDDSPPEANDCCDNCQAASAMPSAAAGTASTQAERAALIVLDTVDRLPWSVGKSLLAQVLKGSQGAAERYANVRNFGKFAALRLSDIEALIVQLLESRYLKQTGGSRPTIKLTPVGQAALKARIAIDVTLPRVASTPANQARLRRSAGETLAQTEQMLAEGRSPEQIAEARGLAVNTIYSHLAELIAQGRVPLERVVPRAVQAQVRAAIAQVGSAEYLSPLKAVLPAGVDYGVIRCVVNAWRRER